MKKDIIDKQFDVLGYKIGKEVTKIDGELLRLKKDSIDLDLRTRNISWFYNRKKLVTNTKEFFNQFLILRDVIYLSEKNKKIIKPKIENLKMISPFDLPIFIREYSALEPFFYDDSVYITGISLDKRNSKDILCDYSHEIIHSQLYMEKGSILNYKNSEVLSIFFEFLSSFYFEKSGQLLNNIIKQRYDNMLYMLNLLIVETNSSELKLNSSMYIESSLIAMKLFDIYMKGDDLIKKEIMHDIQNIIDGKIILEAMLNKYDINFENSKKENLFKKYIK